MVIVTGVLSPMQYKPTQGSLEFGDNCKGIQRVVTAPRKRLSFQEMEAKMRWYENRIRELEHELHLKDIDIEALKNGTYKEPESNKEPMPDLQQVYDLIKDKEEELEKEKEYFKASLAEAQSKEELLHQQLLDSEKARKEAEDALRTIEGKLEGLTGGWVHDAGEGALAAGGDPSSVTTKFQAVIQDNAELKQLRDDLRSERDEVLGQLRTAEQNARDALSKVGDLRDQNRTLQATVKDRVKENQEVQQELQEYRSELYQTSSKIQQLESKLTWAAQTEFTLTNERDDLQEQLKDKEALEEKAFEDAARADEERNRALEMLKSLTQSLSPGGSALGRNEGEDELSTPGGGIVDQVKALEQKVTLRQGEAQEAQAMLNKTVIAQQWVHAKDRALIDQEKEKHDEELRQRDEMLRMAHDEHANEVQQLRKEIVNCSELMAKGREALGAEKAKIRQLEAKRETLVKQAADAERQKSVLQESNATVMRDLREEVARGEQTLAAVSKREKQLQLFNQKLQHDTLITDKVLAEHLSPAELGPIRAAIMDQMEDDYQNATQSFAETSSAIGTPEKDSQTHFGKVHKMYTDVLEQKAVVVDQVRQLQAEQQVKEHELNQSLSRESALTKQMQNCERQLERRTRQGNEYETKYLTTKEELTQTRARMETKLRTEREEVKTRTMELEAAMLRVKDEGQTKYDALKNDNQIKEMKLQALQNELDALYSATKETQDTPFSKAVKKVIQKQRADRTDSMNKIVHMHNSRTPSTPRRDADSSVEDMYRDLLIENNSLKAKIAQLQQELRMLNAHRATSGMQPSIPTSSASRKQYAALSSTEAAQMATELLESRRLMMSQAGTASNDTQISVRNDLEAYRQDLLKRSRESLEKGLFEEPLQGSGHKDDASL